jgi:hypothetical protein
VGEQDVHRGPNGCMGEQNCRSANLAKLTDYSTEKWLEQRQYLQATAEHSQFRDAAFAAQELAVAVEEGKTTVMMFALHQDQYKTQLKAMAAANKEAMDAMLKHMNVLIAGQGKAADKVTATIPSSNTGQTSNTTNRKKKVCMNCEKLVFYKLQTCSELEANVSKHHPGWKSSTVDSGMV